MSDLKWPAAIENGVKAVSIASKAMFVLYCIGIAATGIAFIAALAGVGTGGRGSVLLSFILNLVSQDHIRTVRSTHSHYTLACVSSVGSGFRNRHGHHSQGGKRD